MRQPRQDGGEGAAAVAEGESQTGMPGQRAAGDQRGDGVGGLERKADESHQPGRADDAFLAARMQRVHEHGGAELFRRGEHRLEARVAQRRAVDIAAELDAAEAVLHQPLQFARGGVRVLHRHAAEAEEALRFARHHGGDGVVDMAGERQRVVERQPIRQQFRHGREHLPRDAHRGHGFQAALDVPALIGDGAEVLAVDDDVLVVAIVRRLHVRPVRAAVLAGIGGKFRRHDVGMDVDGVWHWWRVPR